MSKRSMRILLAIAVERQWEIDQIDVITASLNSPLDVTVYMEQPPYFSLSEPGRKPKDYVRKLIKSLYGLRQSGRNWNTFVDATLLKLGFSRCLNDPCIYTKSDLITGLYVDDMLIIGVREQIDRFKTEISEKLEIKDLGKASMILSHRIRRGENSLSIDQSLYMIEVLSEFNIVRLFWSVQSP